MLILTLGFVLRVIGPHLEILKEAVELIPSIDIDVVFLIVLPILILESSLTANWYTIKKEFWQILCLSTTLTMLNAVLMGFSLKYILGYSFSWDKLIILGLLLTFPDHLATNSILKEIFASERLEALIFGETLFNQAIVLVIFEVILNIINDSPAVPESISFVFRLILGGIFIGTIFSICMSIIVKRILNDLHIETTFILSVAYLLFFTCFSTSIKVSGPVGILVYGLYISAYGKTIISSDIQEEMIIFINVLSKDIEGILYIASGITMANYSVYENSELESFDYACVIIVFLISYVIRAIGIIVHVPLLKNFGYGVGFKDIVTCIFANIRGIFNCILAFIILNDSHFNEEKFKVLTIYLVIGTSWISLLLSPFFFKYIIKFLRLEEINDVQENMLAGVTKAIVEEFENKIGQLQSDKDFKLIHWDNVLKLAGPSQLVKSILKKSKKGKKMLHKSKTHEAKELLRNFTSQFTLTRGNLKVEMRRRYFNTLKGLYLHAFETGMCNGESSLILMNSCNLSLDKDTYKMHDWSIVKNIIFKPSLFRFYSRLSTIKCIGGIFRRLLYKKVIQAYDVAHNFIKYHKETEELIDKMEIDIDKTVFEEIIKEAEEEIDKAQEFLRAYVIDTYPEILSEVQTKRSSKALLYYQRKTVEKIYKHGLINEIEYETLINTVESAIRIITFKGLPSMPILREIMINRFPGADSSEMNFLLSKIIEKKYQPDTNVFEEGEEFKGAFFIIRGRVNEKSSWIDQELIIGNIVGVQYLLPGLSNTYLSTAKTYTYAILAVIPKEIIEYQSFVSDLYKEAAEEYILLNRRIFDLVDANEKYIIRIAGASTVAKLDRGKSISFREGGFVFKGLPYSKLKGHIIKPSGKIREIEEESIVMMFPKDFSLCLYKGISVSEALKSFYIKTNSRVNAPKDCQNEEISSIGDSRIDDSQIITGGFENSIRRPTFYKQRIIVPTN
ncbi:hypothetical protein SteCoe_11570 [Stentor coeruleus]|uniref:Cyclic nucleotide-binding domain-containing protein n=1 Tax=Stentor coeruleus TaxID=5963 RepID=A0A1R2CCW7_9CILI|nr:hypothetical protein SteCoe_11570 [Stentor coeruleus]